MRQLGGALAALRALVSIEFGPCSSHYGIFPFTCLSDGFEAIDSKRILVLSLHSIVPVTLIFVNRGPGKR